MDGRLRETLEAELREAAARARDALGLRDGDAGARPPVGLVLGSGLGGLVDRLEDARRIAFADLPHMAPPGVAGHAGELVAGRLEGRPVRALRGRVHLYEGHPPARVVFGARLLARLGCEVVVLTNAAGGIAPNLGPGSLLLLSDHLNLTGRNPLVAAGEGPAFVDLQGAYDPGLRDLARGAAAALGVPLAEGVYAGLLGPSYETPAEIRMLRALGADAVGMSTVLETIALRHLGVRVLALSVITNAAAGLPGAVCDHEDVQRAAAEAGARLEGVVRGVLRALPGGPG